MSQLLALLADWKFVLFADSWQRDAVKEGCLWPWHVPAADHFKQNKGLSWQAVRLWQSGTVSPSTSKNLMNEYCRPPTPYLSLQSQQQHYGKSSSSTYIFNLIIDRLAASKTTAISYQTHSRYAQPCKQPTGAQADTDCNGSKCCCPSSNNERSYCCPHMKWW